MRVQEISTTIHGELPMIGAPCVIVRLAGCNLNCPYCDAPDEVGYEMTISDILVDLDARGIKHVLLTGGEPLLQVGAVVPLIQALLQNDYVITVETNGTIDLAPIVGLVDHVAMDIKLFQPLVPVTTNNLGYLQFGDVVKLVYQNEQELLAAINLAVNAPESWPVMIVFSPTDWSNHYAEHIINFQAQRTDLDIRLQVQIHKALNLA